MALRLEPWANAATAMPFDARHGPGIAFAARVTASQLGKIMAAGDLAAYVVETGSHSPRFTVAEDTRTDWADF